MIDIDLYLCIRCVAVFSHERRGIYMMGDVDLNLYLIQII